MPELKTRSLELTIKIALLCIAPVFIGPISELTGADKLTDESVATAIPMATSNTTTATI